MSVLKLMRKAGLVAIFIVLISIIFVSQTQAIDFEIKSRYAVGGELLSIPFLTSPLAIIMIAIILLVLGGAIITGKLKLEIIEDKTI